MFLRLAIFILNIFLHTTRSINCINKNSIRIYNIHSYQNLTYTTKTFLRTCFATCTAFSSHLILLHFVFATYKCSFLIFSIFFKVQYMNKSNGLMPLHKNIFDFSRIENFVFGNLNLQYHFYLIS
jgi:hypothetical protein